jgi:hypothetical protein
VVGALDLLEETSVNLTVGITGRVIGHGGPDQLDAHLDRVMDELEKLDAGSPSIDATLANGTVDISVGVQADSWDDAVKLGLDTIRTAIHAAGGATPDWPTELSPQEWGITLGETSVRKSADGDLIDA